MTDKHELEKLLEEHEVIRAALDRLFDSPELALEWINNPKVPLSGRTPRDCLTTEPELVLEMLERIERGDFS
ncbi:MbcA/ParS/Xre antitoxin family protein [Vibrio tapetis]|uniref:Antitoxin Xre/MbcA/ParS-like toxin-binding domain-containing protein n=1 Tax=Vibrio tapetis subsp. tapetis TaxID=1671868 RepID=A0A2N8ZAU1_9VIBR|nr:MbcA/ParS/Xre antitoxin family protein [Vibrio tapetis]SON49021.1 conserved protein of unknown function [Vibrio tapetis subsp. tapetis]